jgi:hypothetical protein
LLEKGADSSRLISYNRRTTIVELRGEDVEGLRGEDVEGLRGVKETIRRIVGSSRWLRLDMLDCSVVDISSHARCFQK